MTKKNYGVKILIMCVLCLNGCFSSPVSGFAIVEPKTATTYHPGDIITIRAVEGSDEKPKVVWLYSTNTHYSELFTVEPYKYSFEIPKRFTGTDTLVAVAKYADGTIIEKEVEINVVLPVDLVLESINAEPQFILLKKLPPESDPNDARIAETESIGVGGLYSDGVRRYIASSVDGTIYTSSNENIVTVSSEGEVTAQGVGAAIITVRNGKFSAHVDVVVKPHKKSQN